jgi:BirA family transcriptional regulator, biotin operon repressor / biotin---[acetyl-CoA-carboxylase] ligase
MADLPADIQPDVIRPLLTGAIGRDLTVFSAVRSTNDLVMAAGQRGAAEGLAILADRQTGGRGRGGRSWSSLPGLGIYTSILLRPKVSAAECQVIPLLVGLAVADAVEEVGRLSPTLKWPNDVLVGKRKLAGILMEMAVQASTVMHLCVGIGLNVLHELSDFPPDVRDSATSLWIASGRPVSRGPLVAALYNALDRRHAAFGAGQRSDLLDEVRRRMPMLGQAITVHAGETRWPGTAVDIAEDGALLVRDAACQVHRIIADEVSIR